MYSLLSEGVRRFKARRYHEMDYDGLLNFFEEHPNKNPLNKPSRNYSDSQNKLAEVVQQAMPNSQSNILENMGHNLKMRRQTKRLTQAELAKFCQVSEKTIKKIEAGYPSSIQTLLKLFDFFDLSEKVLEATALSSFEKPIDTIRRIRHRKK